MTADEDDNDDETTIAGVAHGFLAVDGTNYTLTQRNDTEQPAVSRGSYSNRFVEHILHRSAN